MNLLKTPIQETLNDYLKDKPVRLHVPFHNGFSNNNLIPDAVYDIDISEVSGYDISGAENPIYLSEKITSSFFNTTHSFYLTNSASSGLVATMLALRKFGKKVILSRNVHKSVINGIILAGLEPVWLEIDFINQWGIFNDACSERLKTLLEVEKNIAGCVIVSPTYEGIISDIKTISALCKEYNIPLIVDEAHGGHLFFLNSFNQYSSIQEGADVVIQSWHKSLGSLTQTGVLHLNNEQYFNYSDIRRSLDLINSTSPSFILLLSLELTRKRLVETKGAFLLKLFELALIFRKDLLNFKDVDLFENNDKLKIYFKLNNISGINFAYDLYKDFLIEVESANDVGLLVSLGQGFDLDKSKYICSSIEKLLKRNIDFEPVKKSEVNLKALKYFSSPRDAFFQGFVNKDLAYDTDIYAECPPGYAVKIPGCTILEQKDK